MVRRTVAFAEAVFTGETTVEGVIARRAAGVAEAADSAAVAAIPVLVDPRAVCRAELMPAVLVDAIMAKVNAGSRIDDAPLVVALGSGFEASMDCHAVVETNRGHDLGRVIWQGPAEPDTKTPGEIGGYKGARVLREPAEGFVHADVGIGDWVREGHVIARIDGVPIVAPFDGMLPRYRPPHGAGPHRHEDRRLGRTRRASILLYHLGQVAGDCTGMCGGHSLNAHDLVNSLSEVSENLGVILRPKWARNATFEIFRNLGGHAATEKWVANLTSEVFRNLGGLFWSAAHLSSSCRTLARRLRCALQ